MDKCVIWGVGVDYERIINSIRFEVYKGNIEIVSLVSDVDSQWASSKDGFLLTSKYELVDFEFDFIIVAGNKYFDEIKTEAMELGVSEDRIINGNVFCRPFFDWCEYISLINNPVTILSDDCLGGFIYHDLSLKFTSPCINSLWDKVDYIKFIKNPSYYFGLPLDMVQECDLRKGQFPVGKLGEGDKEVRIIFNHSLSFQQAKALWDKRVKRVNKDRIFVKMTISPTDPLCEDLLSEFNKIKYPKACFYPGETDVEDVIYTKRFEWHVKKEAIAKTLRYDLYVLNEMKMLCRDINFIKLLNGEKEYLR